MQMASRFLRQVFVCAALLYCAACSSPPPVREVTEQERIAQEHSLGKLLAETFEPHLVLKKDVEVSVYLRRVAEGMASKSDELKNTPLGVLTIENHQGRWRSFGFPGNRIYLSV